MNSRYDFMKNSKVLDIDGIEFPDPLSIKYGEEKIYKIPNQLEINLPSLSKFWKFYFDKYGSVYYDDIFLSTNNIDYLMNLEPGDNILEFLPSQLTPKTVSFKIE